MIRSEQLSKYKEPLNALDQMRTTFPIILLSTRCACYVAWLVLAVCFDIRLPKLVDVLDVLTERVMPL
ncbi:hypothetical protein MHYP_G00341430 [Metynnis hypsauchen]